MIKNKQTPKQQKEKKRRKKVRKLIEEANAKYWKLVAAKNNPKFRRRANIVARELREEAIRKRQGIQ